MARKKAARKRKGKKGGYIGFFLFLLVLCSIAATVYFVFLRQGTVGPLSPPLSGAPKKKPVQSPALPASPHPSTIAPSQLKREPTEEPRPLISILIDDMGFQDKICSDLLALDLNLSFAFLPYGPHTAKQLEEARKKKRDILLHLPMEPRDGKWSPGPGALSVGMSTGSIRAEISKDFDVVPHIIGVNNHMGSRFTENRPAMRACLALLKEHDLFFLDSLTSANSVGYAIAKEMGIRAAKRDIFIDNNQEPAEVAKQLDALIRLAGKKGFAIGIGHPHPGTLAALKNYQAKLNDRVQLVGVSQLVK